MRRMRTVVAAVTLIGAAISVVPAAGQGPVYSDRAVFDAAAPGLAIEDFEDLDLGPHSAAGCQKPLDHTSFCEGAVSPGQIAAGLRITTVGQGDEIVVASPSFKGSGHVSTLTMVNSGFDHLRLEFPEPVNAVGMDVNGFNADGPCTVTLLAPDGLIVVTIQTVCTNGGERFVGFFELETAIGAVEIAYDGDPLGTFEGADNIRFGVVERETTLETEPAILSTDPLGPTLTYAATLTTDQGPLVGRTIDFSVGTVVVCSAATGLDGRASCGSPVDAVRAIGDGYVAVYGGELGYAASHDDGQAIG